jgi:DNA modification methylase
MNAFTLCGDCLEELKTFADNKFDAIITDPPYGLSFMGKKWDYDVPSVEIWKECLRVLKPGGHLLSFSSARTYHRMVVNVEDAGFEIRDQLMWVYGSGFPKSHNVAIAIDKKLAGMEHRGKRTNYGTTMITSETQHLTSEGNLIERDKAMPKHEPMCEESKKWEGWGTALKPAHEPIVLARKPMTEKTIAENVLKWGTGAINIDKSRVPTDDVVTTHSKKCDSDIYGTYGNIETHQTKGQELGRFPANFIHDGSQGVLDLFPDTKSSKRSSKHNKKTEHTNTYTPAHSDYGDHNTYSDEGSAARFFYTAKTSKKERGEGNTHPTVKPQKLMTYLCGLITPPNGVILDPFMGSGSTGVAAVASGFSFVGIDREPDYVEISRKRIENTGV